MCYTMKSFIEKCKIYKETIENHRSKKGWQNIDKKKRQKKNESFKDINALQTTNVTQHRI